MNDKIVSLIKASIAAHERLLDDAQVKTIEAVAAKIVEAYKSCRKLVVFGNGGSASDAQHWVAELVVRFEKNRMALPALALTVNSSNLTAIGNDFSYDEVFSRQVEAFVQKGDVVVGISTSGTSPNVVKGIEAAKKLGAVTVGFTNEKGGRLKEMCDVCFCAPSPVTGRVQECHILAIHIICSLVEENLFGTD